MKPGNAGVLFACFVILAALLIIAQVRNLLFYDVPRVAQARGVDLPFHFKDKSELLGPAYQLEELGVSEAQTYSVAVADLNNDGWEDLILVVAKYPGPPTLRILLNQRGKGFLDATKEMGVEELLAGRKVIAAAAADLNNEGHKDLVVTFAFGKCAIFRGDGHRFIEPDKNACPDFQGDGRAINFFDFNNDGLLDIYLSSLMDGTEEWRRNEGAVRKTNCGEQVLLQNMGAGRFRSVTASSGLLDTQCNFGISVADLNDDGRPDVVSPTDFGFDRLLLNKGGVKFENVADESFGLSRSRYSMGVDVADIFGEGRTSIYITNTLYNPGLWRGPNSLWHNTGTVRGVPRFEDIADATKTNSCGQAWGTRFIDPDRNGFPDLFVASGTHKRFANGFWYTLVNHSFLFPQAIRWFANDPWFYNEPRPHHLNQCLFLNSGRIEPWKNVAVASGIDSDHVAFSVASFDFNNDGQEDLVILNMDASPSLYQGEYLGKNRWLGVQLRGSRSNRDGIGAVLRLKVGAQIQTRQIFSGGLQAFGSLKQIFGIPEGGSVDELEIRWPSGSKQHFHPAELDRYYTITEPQ